MVPHLVDCPGNNGQPVNTVICIVSSANFEARNFSHYHTPYIDIIIVQVTNGNIHILSICAIKLMAKLITVSLLNYTTDTE